jgi:hypothetical protein
LDEKIAKAALGRAIRRDEYKHLLPNQLLLYADEQFCGECWMATSISSSSYGYIWRVHIFDHGLVCL